MIGLSSTTLCFYFSFSEKQENRGNPHCSKAIPIKKREISTAGFLLEKFYSPCWNTSKSESKAILLLKGRILDVQNLIRANGSDLTYLGL